MPDSTPSSNPSVVSRASEPDVAVQILGTDPWMRFDLWANRAWEAVQDAVSIATSNGPNVSSDEDLDHRIIAMFHSAKIAQEFAEMVCPLLAVSDVRDSGSVGNRDLSNITLDMLIDGSDHEQ